MNEAQVNGTEADETQADGTLDGDTLADETQADGGGGDGLDVERLRRLRLSGFLRELVRAEGRMEAAELLGVAYRTVVRAEESGEITGRMSDALERLLGTGDDPEVARLRERVGALEERLEGGMESLAKELRDGLHEIRWRGWARRSLSGSGGWTRRSSPWSLPTTIRRSTAMRGRWSRSGAGCGPVTPAGAGTCRGSRPRSGCSGWSWRCWRSTG